MDMNITDFAKGMIVGVLSGGAAVLLLRRRGRRKCGVMGMLLKITGSALETVSKTLNI